MPYGLLSTGFVPKSLEVIREELNAEARAKYGASIDVSDGSILGNLIGIVAEQLADLWSLSQAVNASQNPSAATGARLDALAELTGTVRNPATESTATLTACGTPTTVVPSGSLVSTVSTSLQFETTASATIGALTAWVASTAYVVGDRRTNSARCYEVTVAGTSAATGGPATTATAIPDGTVTWRYLGEGTGAVDVAAQAIVTGPTVAVAYDLANIDTPVAGWSSVLNLEDATVGTIIESDEALRARRTAELSAAGASSADALRASLLEVDGVTEAHVFHNTTDVTDGDGVPPHGVEAVVLTPTIDADTDDAVRQVLFDEVAAGNPTHGGVTGTVTDSEGVPQTVKFSRPTEKDVYVIINVVVNPAGAANSEPKFPADGVNQIKAAIVAGMGSRTGANVVSSVVGSKAFNVDGVLEVTSTLVSVFPTVVPVASTTVAISTREIADYDTSRITVNTTNGTP